jgi:hypothetical protein
MGQRKGEERKGEERRGEERRGKERKGKDKEGMTARSVVRWDQMGWGVCQVVVNRDENQSSICTTQSNDARS